MGHGTKPYGRSGPYETVHGLQDMGELAVRLGSPDTFDRRGNIVFWDGFEGSTNKWTPTLAGANADWRWTAEHARTGGFAGQLRPGDGGAGVARIRHREPYPVMSRFGLEASFNMNLLATPTDLILDLSAPAGGLSGRIRYDWIAGTLQYMDNGGLWVNLDAALGLPAGLDEFNTFKIVIDGIRGEYVRCIVNERAYVMTGIPLAPVYEVIPPCLGIHIQANSVVPFAGPHEVDDVIVTQNEP